MREQNYKNHRKYYAPHHFIFMPLTFILLGYGIWKSIQNEDSLVWILFSICIFLILFAGTMLRQHYALGNQNRIIRLEFRQRYFEIFGKSADEVLKHLTFDQISALRFAYDDEFKTLLNRAITEKASGDKLKRSITNWKPDHNRV